MDRIAEIAYTGAQEGAISGSRGTFLGAQVEVPKGVILGPYKIYVGEAKKSKHRTRTFGALQHTLFGSSKG